MPPHHLLGNLNQGLAQLSAIIFETFVLMFLSKRKILFYMLFTSCFTQFRELLNQIYKEGRILLTRDAKLLKYQYLATNQVYKVKSLLKHDQLAEVCAYFDRLHLNFMKSLQIPLWIKITLVKLIR
jgi:hypothetical protein